MATIIFYEKPGCINGEKQKNILMQAGHTVQCRDILSFPWTWDNLLPFCTGKDPSQIINPTAPKVKKGEIVPTSLSFEQAMGLMIGDPLLIKRPLIEVDGLFIQSFDHPALKHYLRDWDASEDVITCPNLQTLSCDEQK